MSQLRNVRYSSEADIIRDVETLRRGYVRGGNWTLAQACWHAGLAPKMCLHEPKTLQLTDEQKKQAKQLQEMLASGKPMPPGLPIAPGTEPPVDAGPEAIDGILTDLKRLEAYSQPYVDFGPFGATPTETFRGFVRLHAANHFSNFEPGGRRANLRFNTEEEVIRDIESLRKGYKRCGAWTLAQVCDHLDRGTKARMKPGPHDPTSPEQAARKQMLEQIIATGELPDGIQAPDFMQPPADCGDAAIDTLIARLREFAQFKGEIAPHRLFGHLPNDVARKLNRIHCARHLSFLTPTTK